MKISYKLICFSLAYGIFFHWFLHVDQARARTTYLISNKASYVKQEAPTSNFGSVNNIDAQKETGKLKYMYLDFPLNNISGNPTINSATLQIKLYSKSGLDLKLQVYPNGEPWSESKITYNSRPGWMARQGEIPVSSTGWVEIDLTTLVKGWYDGTFNRYGVMIGVSTSSGNGYVQAYSNDSNYQPKLKVEYTLLEISLASWGVFRADDPVSNNTEYFVMVTDSNGISDDGSDHTVKVQPPSGNPLTLSFDRKINSTSAYYHLFKSGTSPSNGGYVFTVTSSDARTASVTDNFVSNPLSAVNYQSIKVVEDGTAPVISWNPVPSAAGYRVNIYDSTGDLYYFTYWTKAASIKIRPGGLQPYSQYRCRIHAAREEKCSDNIQNTSWSYIDRTKGTAFQTGASTTYPCEGLCYDDGTLTAGNQPWSDETGSEIAVRFLRIKSESPSLRMFKLLIIQ